MLVCGTEGGVGFGYGFPNFLNWELLAYNSRTHDERFGNGVEVPRLLDGGGAVVETLIGSEAHFGGGIQALRSRNSVGAAGVDDDPRMPTPLVAARERLETIKGAAWNLLRVNTAAALHGCSDTTRAMSS